jgi:hypothetical protein
MLGEVSSEVILVARGSHAAFIPLRLAHFVARHEVGSVDAATPNRRTRSHHATTTIEYGRTALTTFAAVLVIDQGVDTLPQPWSQQQR